MKSEDRAEVRFRFVNTWGAAPIDVLLGVMEVVQELRGPLEQMINDLLNKQ